MEEENNTIQILESRINSINRSLDSIEEENKKLNERIDKIEEENKKLRDMVINNVSVEEKAEFNISDAEKVLINGWESVPYTPTQNQIRAIKVLKNWKMITHTTPRDNTIRSVYMKDIKDDIDDLFDINVYFVTVERIAEQIEQLTNEKIIIKQREGKENSITQVDDLITNVEELNKLN
jgi:septal ring factor EnvC (AmiA/AmiB activator)